MKHVNLPKAGSRRRQLLEALPAKNRAICEQFDMHSGEVAREMTKLREQGLVDRTIWLGKATWELTDAADRALARAA